MTRKGAHDKLAEPETGFGRVPHVTMLCNIRKMAALLKTPYSPLDFLNIALKPNQGIFK